MRERMTAVRASVVDIVNGTFREDNGPHVVSPQGVELRRVALVGLVVDKYSGQGYASITIDDGTETIRAKAWGGEANSLDRVQLSILALIVGKVREYEGELYIVPEIVRELDDPNYMTLHLMERYSAMLTRSGVTPEVTSELEEFIEDVPPTKSESLKEKKEPSISGKVYKQIMQYIELQSEDDGVPIKDIVDFFEGKGHDRTDIQLKVLDLQSQGKLVEVKVGVYRPSDA
ncbi:MAG: OB-fold nucleic acid binding domain-containing protein [Candidatus Thorarchaeota archaeon]